MTRDPFRNFDAWLEAPIQRMYEEAEREAQAFEDFCEARGYDPETAWDDPTIKAEFDAWCIEQDDAAAEREAEAYADYLQDRADADNDWRF
jgi:hypothetical protein